jgi:hypothetical protein
VAIPPIEARDELERRRKDLRIADADGLAGARQILVGASPAVILARSAPVVNPLTGILGNAELLLEARRGTLDLPLQTLQRLETIAELAVRMRETVRHLSDRWEAAGASGSESDISARNRPTGPSAAGNPAC